MKGMTVLAAVLFTFSALQPVYSEGSVREYTWSMDRLEENAYPCGVEDVPLEALRQASQVKGIEGDAVRLSRLDALRCESFEDVVADGTFAISFWVKVEWVSRRWGHGDVINFITSDEEHPWVWRIGFPTTEAQVMPAAPWPLALHIGEGISTEELPVDIEPWQWTHVGFVGNGESVGVYRNGGLIGFVEYPEDGLAQGSPGRGTLQVNGSNNFDLDVEKGRQGVWECDLRIDALRLVDAAVPPEVDFPAYLKETPSLLHLKVRLAGLVDATADDRELIGGMIRRVEQIDNGEDTRGLRHELLARIDAALEAMEQGKRPLTRLRGHLRLTYRSAVDLSIQPYEVYVPHSWKGKEPTALVIALHGSTEDETVYFERYSIEEQAEQRGWIVATPYGRGERCYRDAGERDVLDVIAQVKRQWKVDEKRIYVTGHSMGAIGAVLLAMAYPEMFAAAAPVAGWAEPGFIEALKNTPVLWVVGEMDEDWAIGTVKEMMAAAEEAGAPHKSLVLEGYDHGGFLGLQWPTVVEFSLPEVFDFFANHSR
jgi:poly(3-hydroxybutyrate) depolymerase